MNSLMEEYLKGIGVDETSLVMMRKAENGMKYSELAHMITNAKIKKWGREMMRRLLHEDAESDI